MTTVEEDRLQARIDGLLEMLRAAEADFRRSYARVLEVVAELDTERAGAVSGFGTTARLVAGVLNLSKGEAKARAEQAGLLTPRRSLTGELLPAALLATAAELAAGAIGPTHVRVITALIGCSYTTVYGQCTASRAWRSLPGWAGWCGWSVGVGGSAGGDLLPGVECSG